MLFLESFEFTKFSVEQNFKPQVVWKLNNLKLNEKINLIVGKNATGKTKTLKEIIRLAILIKSGEITSDNYCLKAFFNKKAPKKDEYTSYLYELEIIKKKITQEKLTAKINKSKILEERILIERNNNKCSIYEEDTREFKNIKPPPSSLALANRDLLKYPYLDDIYEWAYSINAYSFGALKEIYAPTRFFIQPPTFEISGIPISEMYTEIKTNIELRKNILKDLKDIDYEIHNIFIGEYPISTTMQEEKSNIFTIFEEKGLDISLLITDISAGMNRAFHTIVVIEYFLMKKTPITLIIDDVGEGLDYKRSTELVKLLIKKVKDSNIQLIITSNDRFLMNIVDLKYWNILYRNNAEVSAFNYYNNKEKFDNFIDIGISNFNYFSDFYEEIEDAD